MPKPEKSKAVMKGMEKTRTGMTVGAIKRDWVDNLFCLLGRFPRTATPNDRYLSLAYTVRDRMLSRWVRTLQSWSEHMLREGKMVCYLSAEFLMGPHLGSNILNLGLQEQIGQAVQELGGDLETLLEQEEEPGLGNGGLGRLAACFLDSLATLEIPAMGYGIRYEFGIFKQEIKDGAQVERTDRWLQKGNPWEIERLEITYPVGFGGRTEVYPDDEGRPCVRWIPARAVVGMAYDTPILGYQVNTCDVLRLWKAQAAESFDFEAFNLGDYYGAVEEKVRSENLSKVLYPNDEPLQGKELRLEQQYFFVSCSLQDMIRIHLISIGSMDQFHRRWAVQLNDTHPSIAVGELMRLLLDVHGMDWDTAWEITTQTFAYTNHTLLPEALEKWPLGLFGRLLPRHLEIIYEINHRFLKGVRAAFPGDEERVKRMSLIDETGERYVRMAHLACVGSHKVNGVAELHSDLLKKVVMKDFYELWPEKFTNVTNGVTPRRWMALANPKLEGLITRAIGEGWLKNLDELRGLESYAEDPQFQDEWRRIKRESKANLARIIQEQRGISVDLDSLFDVQAKRIHEYKRQHLQVLHIVTLYNRIRKEPGLDIAPRTFIFGGKAAPGYFLAKLIIRLINSVASVVNNDPTVRGRIKVVFVPNFNVKNGQRIYPAADLSEQISLAGKEASGTGNMKFSMNGALTIGTLDGANVEILQEVGPENFFLFGLRAEEVQEMKTRGYHPLDYYHSNPELREAVDLIRLGHFSPKEPDLFKPLVDSLLNRDEYMVLADYQSYIDCQARVEISFRDPAKWTRMSILNVARIGKFSSDRSIREYCERIWKASPVHVDLKDYTFDDMIQEQEHEVSLRLIGVRS